MDSIETWDIADRRGAAAMSERFACALVTPGTLPPFGAQARRDCGKTTARSAEPLREIITAELYLVKQSAFRGKLWPMAFR